MWTCVMMRGWIHTTAHTCTWDWVINLVASQQGHVEAVRLLVRKGAWRWGSEFANNTPLHNYLPSPFGSYLVNGNIYARFPATTNVLKSNETMGEEGLRIRKLQRGETLLCFTLFYCMSVRLLIIECRARSCLNWRGPRGEIPYEKVLQGEDTLFCPTI